MILFIRESHILQEFSIWALQKASTCDFSEELPLAILALKFICKSSGTKKPHLLREICRGTAVESQKNRELRPLCALISLRFSFTTYVLEIPSAAVLSEVPLCRLVGKKRWQICSAEKVLALIELVWFTFFRSNPKARNCIKIFAYNARKD